MGVDEGNLLLIVMGVERYILTSSSYDVPLCAGILTTNGYP